ncbi:MAG: hypothetical protein N3F03_01665 [Ignavibacteria bacterium]|nr:hypothetical protein [Ignavibacteria bacterium]
MKNKLKFVFLLLILVTAFHPLYPLTVEYIGIERMTKESQLVIYGRVLSQYSVWEDKSIFTYTTIEIKELIKGQYSSQKIVVKQMGGTVGYISQVVDGTPKLEIGKEVVLFLRDWKGAYWIHSIVLGYFQVYEENGKVYAVNSLNNVGLVDPTTKKLITDVSKLENRFELNAFIQQIKNYAKM